MEQTHYPRLVVIGLGGIYEGYGPQLPLLHTTGVCPVEEIFLMDGDRFEEKNSIRQHPGVRGEYKAVIRRQHLAGLFPGVAIRAFCEFVRPENVAGFIPDRSIVLCSPDNHPTRLLVSRHCQTLDTCLLIAGGNSGINEPGGAEGQYGLVQVYARREGRHITAPIELYHPEIAEGTEPPPWDPSCAEAISHGGTQVFKTNLLVGSWMLWMLLHYILQPWGEAQAIAEVALHAGTGSVVPYWRPPKEDR